MERNYQFTHVSDTENCGVILYDRKTGAVVRQVPFPAEKRIGRVYKTNINLKDRMNSYLYQFYEGEKRLPDPKGRAFFAAKKYGDIKGPEDVYTVLDIPAFDWSGDVCPRIPYENSLIYCLHVRGFTKHISSGVKGRGCFLGVTEKIPYLKELGVTTLEFQPIYEFNEREKAVKNHLAGAEEVPRLNYWGYTKGYYFAPKADYAKLDAVSECREMIRTLHQNRMEIVMQMYFPGEVNPLDIPEILRFWVEEYHVDGFHLIGENLPAELLAKDPALSETKLWYYRMDTQAVYGRTMPAKRSLGLVRDDFMYDCRRFLKGDENMVPSMMHHMRNLPAGIGTIHYLSTYWGFTMMDMVSYDFKHNEANGEENHDGTDYNCSWNCGEEGFSRKKRIQRMRIQQIKNAFSLLLFSQATPRIFMGDEFGNSQRGNNNPYCQDNEVTWLNWRNLETNREIFEFLKELLKIRNDNPVLHPSQEASMMDSLSCGYPDLSFHGMTAWRPQMEHYSRQLGILYCGYYDGKGKGTVQKQENSKGFELIFLGINMHWENHELAFPRLAKGKRWEKLFSTDGMKEETTRQDKAVLAPKTVAVYTAVSVPEEEPEQVALQTEADTKQEGNEQ